MHLSKLSNISITLNFSTTSIHKFNNLHTFIYLNLSKLPNIPNIYIYMYIIQKTIFKVNAHIYNPKKQSWTCEFNVHVYNRKKESCTCEFNVHVYNTKKESCTCEFNVHVYNPKIKLLRVQVNYNIYIYIKNNVNNSLNRSPPLSSTRVFPWNRNNLQHV